MNSISKRMKKAKSQIGDIPLVQDYEKTDANSIVSSSGELSVRTGSETTDSESSHGGSEVKITQKTKKKSTIIDCFVPKPNKRMDRIMGHIKSDGDVWVERVHVNEKGSRIYYYRSVRTNRCIWLEPPTGAGTLVYLTELDKFPYLREFALGPLDRPVSEIEKPDFYGPSYREQAKVERKQLVDKTNSKKNTSKNK